MTRVGSRRVLVAAAGLAIAALALAGCAAPLDPSWQPPAWPAAAAVVGAVLPDPLDPATVPDLNGQRIRNDAVGIQARYSFLPGDQAINARLVGIVKDAVGARSAATKTAYKPAVFPTGTGMGDRSCARGSTTRPAAEVLADAALGPAGGSGSAVVCDVVAAAGNHFGERIRVVTGDASAIASDVSTVLYTDVTTGELATADQLWTADAPVALWDDVVDAMRRSAGSLSLAGIQPPDDAGVAAVRAALATTVVAPDGSLVVTLPAGFTAPELAALGLTATTAPTIVALPPAVSAPLITPFAAGLVAATAQATPFAAPAVVPAGFEEIDCTLVPCVAMTYDDGPSDLTAGILDAVAAHHFSVTFFAMGEKARQYADVMKRAVAEGNLVENHTWNHPHLPTLTAEQVSKQIDDTQASITAADGQAPRVFRPPYGEYNAEVLVAAGLPAILWDVDTLDWQGPADDVLTDRAVNQPKPGSIVLQHDIQPNTGRTVSAVYDGLRDRGFTVVNIQQLFGGTLPTHGAYRSGR